jgi:hypothetical protein
MNLSQQDIEIAILAHITRNPKAMDKIEARKITEDHFVFVEDGAKNSYTKALFILKLLARFRGVIVNAKCS